MSEQKTRTKKVWDFIENNSLLLISGALLALFLANNHSHLYHELTHVVLVEDFFIGHLHDGHRTLTLHYLVNDVLMALFFAIAGKEVWEAVALKDGSLRGKQAWTTVIATSGGMFGPIALYLGLAYFMGSTTFDAVKNGWAIPTATDIAFAYLAGRLVFGAGHPAIKFLLALAIIDDAAGLIIVAVFYPQNELQPVWLLLPVIACVSVWLVFNKLPRSLDKGKQRRPYSTMTRKIFGAYPYVFAGMASWYGFQESGLHPALGLLPVIPFIPHADRAFGIFADEEKYQHDLLNDMEHALKYPVQFVLFLFGFMNSGVEFSTLGGATWLVLAGLLIGKPLGISIMGVVAAKVLGLGMPAGMRLSDLPVIGMIAGIGFTVSLFVASVAFPAGEVQDAAKMGALFSFFAIGLSLLFGKIFRVQKVVRTQEEFLQAH